jgi:transposase
MPASYVKPHVKRRKNDATDVEAICEAVTRPTMRFVPVKSEARTHTTSSPRTLDPAADNAW